jgi:hypothetical protein
MRNLLEQAINSRRATTAKLIQEALGIESDDVANEAFRRRGRLIASSTLASASGFRPRQAS